MPKADEGSPSRQARRFCFMLSRRAPRGVGLLGPVHNRVAASSYLAQRAVVRRTSVREVLTRPPRGRDGASSSSSLVPEQDEIGAQFESELRDPLRPPL